MNGLGLVFKRNSKGTTLKISTCSRRITNEEEKKNPFAPNNVLILEIVGKKWKKPGAEDWLIFYTRALIIPRHCTARNIPVEPVNVTQAP